MSKSSSPSPFGKVLSILLIAILVGAGLYVIKGKSGSTTEASSAGEAATVAAPLKLAETQTSVPGLDAPGTARFKDNTVEVELSEYAGYAGLLVANGGTQPTENSLFFKKYGFKVRLTFQEEDNWSGLNSGRFAASATTTDVLAVYGNQLQVRCPLLIGYSRGADGIVVRSEIRRINQLMGKTVVAAQFNESDFFLRYLAQEAGIGIRALSSLRDAPAADSINVVYAEDALSAGDLFLEDLESGANRLAGCVTYAPKTSEVVSAAGGKARLLVTNKNLLIISDILLMNKGFAADHPKVVEGLAAGILEGNRQVRANGAAAYAVLKEAFGWSAEESKAELAQIHFANLPENEAYFAGTIDMAGSFGGIFQTAVMAYGTEYLPDPAGFEKFIDGTALASAAASGIFSGEKIAISPIKSGMAGSVEADPLLSKDIRFQFNPNSSNLVLTDAANQASLTDIQQLLRVSPGSMLRLRGHVDNSNYDKFKAEGEATLRKAALGAMKLSQDRANEIKRLLTEQFKVDAERIDTVGRGWEEPAGENADLNRRVEVLWFTLE